MKFYVSSALIVPFIIGMMNIVYLNGGNSLRWPYILYSVWFSCFVFAAFYSTIYAGCTLIRPGISGQVRSLILKRHVFYIIFFLMSNMYLFIIALTYSQDVTYKPTS